MSKPKILISCSQRTNSRKYYIDAVEASGAEAYAVYLPEYSDTFDGLILAGGVDVEPYRYGDIADETVTSDKERDEYEISLIEAFRRENKPIFGICRGIQIMNVAFGGSLIVDLPKEPDHRTEDGGSVTYHEIITKEASLINKLYGEKFIANSYHHQAVKTPADGFRVTAKSPDGVIEAIEHENPIWFGVQFHPERMTDTSHSADGQLLFDYFISLCKS